MRLPKLLSFVIVMLLLITCLAGTVSLPTVALSSSSHNPSSSPRVQSGTSTHAIEYQVGLPPSMVDDGEIQYFGAHHFTTVYLVVGDNQTYKDELNVIKALGMKPVIDVEFLLWRGEAVNTSISNFSGYFQSLKDAGWQYVATEGGRAGDATYLKQFFSEYVNFNCDNCGLWQDIYKDNATTLNSWESYYSSEVQYIQNGTLTSAPLGIKNGILAGVWPNDNGTNEILANSLSDLSPSYKSMLDWSYANGTGFSSFGVFFNPGPGTAQLPQYKQLGFEQIVANLQARYPAIGSWRPPTRHATSLTLNVTRVTSDTYAVSGTLGTLLTGSPVANANVYLEVCSSSEGTWQNFAVPAGANPTTTNPTGSYNWVNMKLTNGTYYFRTYYDGDGKHMESFAPSVHGVQVTV
ncbi:MAG: hypothetical protein ACXVI5_06900 [Halobacteriota archaeon]